MAGQLSSANVQTSGVFCVRTLCSGSNNEQTTQESNVKIFISLFNLKLVAIIPLIYGKLWFYKLITRDGQ